MSLRRFTTARSIRVCTAAILTVILAMNYTSYLLVNRYITARPWHVLALIAAATLWAIYAGDRRTARAAKEDEAHADADRLDDYEAEWDLRELSLDRAHATWSARN